VKYKILSRKGWRFEQLRPFNPDGIVEFESVTTLNPIPKKPQYVPIYSANFAFSHSDVLKEVPYPNLPYLFFGEELLMAALAFTNGWDLVGMTHSVAYHLWVKDYRKQYINNDPVRRKSVQRVKDILNGKDKEIKLGNKRSIQEFWDYLGINFEKIEFTRPHQPWTMPKKWKTLSDSFRN
jgi:hypothetical protein